MLSFKLIYHFASPAQWNEVPVAPWPYQELVQVSSVAQSCPTLCDSMNSSMPGLPVHHQLPESTQSHVHCVSDAIQRRPLLLLPSIFPSIRVFSNESALRIWWPKYWEFELQYQFFQWTPRISLGWTGITIFFHFIHHMCVVVSYCLKLKFLKDKWCANFYTFIL